MLVAQYGQFNQFLPLNANNEQIKFEDLVEWEIRKFAEQQIIEHELIDQIIVPHEEDLLAKNLDKLLHDEEHFVHPTNPHPLEKLSHNLQKVCQIFDGVSPQETLKKVVHNIHSDMFTQDLSTESKRSELRNLFEDYYFGKRETDKTRKASVTAARQFLAPYLATVNHNYTALGSGHPISEDYTTNNKVVRKKLDLGISEFLVTELVRECVAKAPADLPNFSNARNMKAKGEIVRERQAHIINSIRLLIDLTILSEGFEP